MAGKQWERRPRRGDFREHRTRQGIGEHALIILQRVRIWTVEDRSATGGKSTWWRGGGQAKSDHERTTSLSHLDWASGKYKWAVKKKQLGRGFNQTEKTTARGRRTLTAEMSRLDASKSGSHYDGGG